MLVAVEGCSHGSLTTIYSTLAQHTAQTGKRVDLLLLCGDFQALRSRADFESMSVPVKYRHLGTFHEYYAGRKVAPVLTIVVGGNHEASNYMWELYHGGWLAENIYYLGAGGSVLVDGVRVCGISGLHKYADLRKGHFEKVPYDDSALRSVYHTRQYDILKMMQLSPRQHTIFMSHDWPTGIWDHGDINYLLRKKPYLREECADMSLGSPPLMEILKHLSPEYWFAAHHHIKFPAVVHHASVSGGASAPTPLTAAPAPAADPTPANPDEIIIEDDFDETEAHPPTQNGHNPDEICLSDEEDFDQPALAAPTIPPAEAKQALQVDESADVVAAAKRVDPDAANGVAGFDALPVSDAGVYTVESSATSSRQTRFLALDKVGPGKDYLQFLDIPSPSPSTSADGRPRICFDPEWLAITRAFHPWLSTERAQPLPNIWEVDDLVQKERKHLEEEGLLLPPKPGDGPDADAVPVEGAGIQLVRETGLVDVQRVQRFCKTAPAEGEPGCSPDAWYTNPQTVAFCAMLGLENKINPPPT